MMKVPRFFRHRKLWAATARRSPAASAGMNFEEMPEPNMKLSRALLIVLLLHVVAVSGIIAFNAIKTRESSFAPAPSPNTEHKPADAAGTAIHPDGANPPTAVAQTEKAPSEDAKPSHSPSKPSSDDDHAKVPSSANATARKPVSSGKTYVVKKGDNPVTIAKKLKVSYDDLIALNHIEDPRKLRIGQKLLIPKATKPKTTNGKAAKPKEKKNEARHAKQQGRST
jgi:LysM repeat protein